ncbi:hypothetical protein EKN56_01980 [Limnobaculum zhutongyuii]|uniref:Uncharacterized protein n=1 Tax=Limnobaculum zhutongyuii TaxID=2498113 RepID=A0A411WG54_9GAMM|nr:hypothetical protein [Limnobaculum zhutongyuii]QBH95280.1 hypothetical protein EKN56_01980 [Limnobaculum zhutongyuii]TQS89102.1 hypothetical protein ELQ32_07920 [Limnobaculum zhutongyuii]
MSEGNTVGKIVGQPPMMGNKAEEANPAVSPETPEEESSWLDYFQTGLDVVGLVPGFGEIADGLNAIIYGIKGDYVNAGLSVGAMIPFAGWASTGTKLGIKATKEIAENSTQKTVKNVTEEAADKTTKKAQDANSGGKSKGKGDKDGPCLIGPYNSLKCPPGNDAHHIIPDYTLRYGTRLDSTKRIQTKPSLPTLKEGMCICLNKKEGKGFNEHKEVHKADGAIKAAGALSKVPGTVKLSTVKRLSTGAVGIVKPECAIQVTAAVEAQFFGIDGDTLLRSTHRLPSTEAIKVLGTLAR